MHLFWSKNWQLGQDCSTLFAEVPLYAFPHSQMPAECFDNFQAKALISVSPEARHQIARLSGTGQFRSCPMLFDPNILHVWKIYLLIYLSAAGDLSADASCMAAVFGLGSPRLPRHRLPSPWSPQALQQPQASGGPQSA